MDLGFVVVICKFLSSRLFLVLLPFGHFFSMIAGIVAASSDFRLVLLVVLISLFFFKKIEL